MQRSIDYCWLVWLLVVSFVWLELGAFVEQVWVGVAVLTGDVCAGAEVAEVVGDDEDEVEDEEEEEDDVVDEDEEDEDDEDDDTSSSAGVTWGGKLVAETDLAMLLAWKSCLDNDLNTVMAGEGLNKWTLVDDGVRTVACCCCLTAGGDMSSVSESFLL